MLRPPMMALWLLFSAALLTGCAAPEPRVVIQSRVERLSVPDALLACAPHPEPGVIVTQRDVAEYAVILADAGEDCRSKLAAVRAIVEQR